MVAGTANYFKIICLGLILYEAANYLSIFYGVSPIILNMFSSFVFIFAFIKLPKNSMYGLGDEFIILILLTVLMLLRGSLMGNYLAQYGSTTFDTSLYAIFRHFFFDHYAIAFLMPLAALIPINRIDLGICKKYGIILSIISIVLAIVHLPQLIMSSSWEGRQLLLGESQYGIRELTNSIFIGVGFTLFMSYCFQYVTGKKKWIYPISLIVFFLCTVAGAGRGSSMMQLIYLLVFFYLWYKNPYTSNSTTSNRGKVIFYLILFTIAITYLAFSTDYFSNLFGRLFEDESNSAFAESGREEFVEEMIRDLDGNPLYWLFGKGINGAYRTSENGGFYRNTIEWGYMFLILKGGILYLITYCFVLLKSFKKGFFNSNNLVCQAFAFMCLFRVISLIPFGLPNVSVEFFLVWIGVKIIHTPQLRAMSNDEIKNYFGL